ncbi:dehydrogenase/reductase SDR family member 1-like [Watersipora subatra]|uniref:dehydrogenase/reductase SDR family member 1-like n=1 Tax=Watersipora subatra TaxID=2589382 RepID=UPI00355C67B3
MALSGKVCLVTGASRGIGKGIAIQLGEAGATVYITGRSSSPEAAVLGGSLKETADEITARGGTGIAVICDHAEDEQVKQLFEKIEHDHGRLDVLVNNAFSGISVTTKESRLGHRFWEHEAEPGEFWDMINRVGLRNYYICSAYAAKMMVKAKQGLIVNISSFGAIRYMFNPVFSIGKAAVDKMSAFTAQDLKPHNVACITLYPGAVLTESINRIIAEGSNPTITENFKVAGTPEYSGRAVVNLACDKNKMAKSGRITITADLAREYGFTDVDGRQRPSPRQLNVILGIAGYKWLSSMVPNFIYVPNFLLALQGSNF